MSPMSCFGQVRIGATSQRGRTAARASGTGDGPCHRRSPTSLLPPSAGRRPSARGMAPEAFRVMSGPSEHEGYAASVLSIMSGKGPMTVADVLVGMGKGATRRVVAGAMNALLSRSAPIRPNPAAVWQ
jgi:hypothetical protein